MALYGAFDKTKHFDELDEPLETQEGVLTPSQRRQRALDNLIADEDVTFEGDVIRAGRSLLISAAGHAKLGGSGAGWVIDGDNALPLVTLPQSQTSEVLLVPIT